MINKMKRWFQTKIRGIDTSPEEFNIWFHGKLGQQLRGGNVYYGIRYVGTTGLIVINEKFQLYKELKNAERKLNSLTRDHPGANLEVVIVRAFYSFSEVD